MQAADAAEALKLTSKDLLKLGLIDDVIAEPLGGAHRSIHDAVYTVEKYILKTLAALKRTKVDNLLENRYKKLRSIGTISVDKPVGEGLPLPARIRTAAKPVGKKAKPVPANV